MLGRTEDDGAPDVTELIELYRHLSPHGKKDPRYGCERRTTALSFWTVTDYGHFTVLMVSLPSIACPSKVSPVRRASASPHSIPCEGGLLEEADPRDTRQGGSPPHRVARPAHRTAVHHRPRVTREPAAQAGRLSAGCRSSRYPRQLRWETDALWYDTPNSWRERSAGENER